MDMDGTPCTLSNKAPPVHGHHTLHQWLRHCDYGCSKQRLECRCVTLKTYGHRPGLQDQVLLKMCIEFGGLSHLTCRAGQSHLFTHVKLPATGPEQENSRIPPSTYKYKREAFQQDVLQDVATRNYLSLSLSLFSGDPFSSALKRKPKTNFGVDLTNQKKTSQSQSVLRALASRFRKSVPRCSDLEGAGHGRFNSKKSQQNSASHWMGGFRGSGVASPLPSTNTRNPRNCAMAGKD